MDTTNLIAGIIAAATVINSGLIVWNFLQSPSKKNGEALTTLTTRVEAVEKKQTELSADMKNLPTKDALHDLQMSIGGINTEVKVVSTEMKAIRETSNLLRDWLVKESAK